MKNMKKSVSIVSLAVIIASFMLGEFGFSRNNAQAVEYRVSDYSRLTPRESKILIEDDIMYMVYDDYAEAIGYAGTDGNMDIKPYVNGKPVTALSDGYEIWEDNELVDGTNTALILHNIK